MALAGGKDDDERIDPAPDVVLVLLAYVATVSFSMSPDRVLRLPDGGADFAGQISTLRAHVHRLAVKVRELLGEGDRQVALAAACPHEGSSTGRAQRALHE